MKVEQAKQIASNAIEQLRQALEAGHSERLKEYLAAMARFRRYSWGNVMLIASQKPNATHVAGFHAWHKLGRFVKKGEKGIFILAPIVRKKAESNGETEPDESSVTVGFRAAYVFERLSRDLRPGFCALDMARDMPQADGDGQHTYHRSIPPEEVTLMEWYNGPILRYTSAPP
jgi:hypothetical protein